MNCTQCAPLDTNNVDKISKNFNGIKRSNNKQIEKKIFASSFGRPKRSECCCCYRRRRSRRRYIEADKKNILTIPKETKSSEELATGRNRFYTKQYYTHTPFEIPLCSIIHNLKCIHRD